MKTKKSQKLKANIIFSLLLQIAVFVSGIILPRLYIGTYGSKVNGLISSIQQFLGFISLGEMGIGAVIQFNLYKPLASKDWANVSNIISAADRFFNKLLKAIIVYVTILALLLPFKTLDEFEYLYTASLVIAISFSYIMQYYFGMTYRQLLDADQLSYVRIIPQIIQILINVIVCSLMIRAKVDVRFVKFTTSILYSIQPIFMFVYAKIHYPFVTKKKEIVGEPIKQKWNGLTQHLATVVLKDTDVVVLTLFSTLENVSIYAVYNLVINGIEVMIESVLNNFTAVFGELIAREKYDELNAKFNMFETLYHTALTIIFFCIGRLIVPFVSVYTKGITDANYSMPVFAIVLTLAQGLYCARLPYHILIKAAGHYKQTQMSAIIEALINISVSIASVRYFGLVGVAFGTAMAMLYRSIYYWIYLSRFILQRSLSKTIRRYGTDMGVMVICYCATKMFTLKKQTYISWFILGIIVFSITTVISSVVLFFTDKRVSVYIKKRLSHCIGGRLRK